MGRWLSQDPIGFAAGDANLYRYVGNGATNAVDPTGLATLRASGGVTVSFLWWHGSLDLEGHVGWSWQKGLSGGVGIQCTTAPISTTNGLGLGANAGFSVVATTAATVGQLNGDTIAVGGHAGLGPLKGSGEIFANKEYGGIEIGPPAFGVGAGGGVYLNENNAKIWANQ